MTVHRLSAPPRLSAVLARGALASRSKRGPYEQARLPEVRLVLPDARIDARRLRAYAHVCGFDGGEGGGESGGDGGQPGAGPGVGSGAGPGTGAGAAPGGHPEWAPGGHPGRGPGRHPGRGPGAGAAAGTAAGADGRLSGETGAQPGAALPPSFPHVLGFPLAMLLMARPDFPFPVLGLVHTGIELTQHRALRLGDRPEISVHAEGPAPHRRGSRFDVVTEARLDGRLVWHSRSTYLCRHRTADAPPSGPPGGEPAAPGTGTAGGTSAPPAPPLPLREHWDLPSGLGRRYARASGDRNPIHLHPLTAKLFGFPRHIAHGMWTFARALAATGAAAGGEQLTARAEFKAPVLLPSAVAFRADEPTASAGGYRAPVRVHRFELSSGGPGAGGAGDGQRLHLTGEVTSERP